VLWVVEGSFVRMDVCLFGGGGRLLLEVEISWWSIVEVLWRELRGVVEIAGLGLDTQSIFRLPSRS
jgi:hypothetical protein